MHKNMHYKNLIIDIFAVTFRKEGVDWNALGNSSANELEGHLPQGRCGLKFFPIQPCPHQGMSPSARKVWIEINKLVDLVVRASTSPSARKVWIEIKRCPEISCTSYSHLPQGRCGLKWTTAYKKVEGMTVTFRKEGVDWNYWWWWDLQRLRCHLPQGRCGLK